MKNLAILKVTALQVNIAGIKYVLHHFAIPRKDVIVQQEWAASMVNVKYLNALTKKIAKSKVLYANMANVKRNVKKMVIVSKLEANVKYPTQHSEESRVSDPTKHL